MPKLRSVERGRIILRNNPYMCYWSGSISFNEILGGDVENRVLLNSTNFNNCENQSSSCNSNCDERCWGPEKDMCQIIYREICPKSCSSGMCYKAGHKIFCCDDACAAGCYGEGKSACTACSKLEQDSKCVAKCNGLTDYDRITRMTVNHTDPRYTYDRYCVERCPDETLIQDDHCVIQCKAKYWHDPNKSSRICEKCPNDICPKNCVLHEAIDSENINELRNCTIIEGYIRIVRHKFEDHISQHPINEKIDSGVKKALTAEMLESLSNVRVVTDFVDIQAREYSPTSLNFLRKLSIIEGRSLSDGYALSIFHNLNLQALGLSALKTIKNGQIYIGNNRALCYVETMHQFWSTVVSASNTINDRSPFRIFNNRNQSLCVKLNAVCDHSCNERKGCWGAGPSMCVECKNYRIDGNCSDHCPQIGYYVSSDKKCEKCSEECLRCTSGGPLNCIECKNVGVQQGASVECLATCASTHFRSGNYCLPCNRSCYHFGCTGYGDHVGEGGCNRCMHAKRACPLCEDPKDLNCLFAYGRPKNVCKDNNLTNYFLTSGNSFAEQFECAMCHSQCSTCSGYGNSVLLHHCRCKNYVLKKRNGDQHCVSDCGFNTYIALPKTSNNIGKCHQCHELCDQKSNCSSYGPNNCTKCGKAGIVIENALICLEGCLEDRPYQTSDLICHHYDLDAIERKKKRLTLIIALCSIVASLMLLIVFAWKCTKYKRQYKREVKMNLPSLPEYEPMDPYATPNMSRLCIISGEHLSRSAKPLGKGAFGTVYAGYWWPNGKDGRGKIIVAIKVVHDPSQNAQQEMLAEAGIMASMRHEHLLRLVGICLCDGLQLVTPLRSLGCLRDFLIKHHQKLGARDLLVYCYQISSAMEYLHKNRLLHRDLAARNVLVKRTNHVEVTDFGLAKMLERGESGVVVGGKVAVKWLALESLQHRVYTHYTDVWAFGVTCWEVLTFGQNPYQGISAENIRSHLESGNRLEQPNNCTQDVYQTLLQCWLEDPESRPNFTILKERLYQYCRAPNNYILEFRQTLSRSWFMHGDQREIVDELLEDNELMNTLELMDQCIESNTSTTSVPSSSSTQMESRHEMISRNSGRYQFEPTTADHGDFEVNEDYLVPKSRDSCTPVVARESDSSEFMQLPSYCNDFEGSEYSNQIVSNKIFSKLESLENHEYFADSETAL